ncbi:MAG: hypothetical protein Ct9H300mP12_10880 [Acidimicrobiales bacterium]|nr:MAG: hypothetical protein Ct9H300mP12_10880 [Acidimicrobiales bacterium]
MSLWSITLPTGASGWSPTMSRLPQWLVTTKPFAHRFDPKADDGISYQGICGIPRPKGEIHGWVYRRSTDLTTLISDEF